MFSIFFCMVLCATHFYRKKKEYEHKGLIVPYKLCWNASSPKCLGAFY